MKPDLMRDFNEGHRIAKVVLTLICRVTGWNFFWFWDQRQSRVRLWLGDANKPGGFFL